MGRRTEVHPKHAKDLLAGLARLQAVIEEQLTDEGGFRDSAGVYEEPWVAIASECAAFAAKVRYYTSYSG